MAKHGKCIAGKEGFDRMNYLYQASCLVANIAIESDEPTRKCAEFLSNYYCNLAINVSKKTVLRMDSEIKRTICKGCHAILIPGANARIRIRKQRVRSICLKCLTCRIYNTKRNYQIWSEKPEALVEIVDCSIENT